MPVFKYQAKASPEETVNGEAAADSVESLAARLIDQGLYPVGISRLQEGHVLRAGGRNMRVRRPRRAALALLTRQMAGMLTAGLTLHAALRLLSSQALYKPMRVVLDDLVERLRDGQQFSTACAAWPGVFSALYVNLIRAGEAGGMLELVLDHLADFLEKEDEVRRQIRAALAYPVLMLGLGMVTVSILMTFVVPRIVSMFDDIGQTLPLPTRVLVAVSGFLTQYWPVILVAGIALAMAAKIHRPTSEFRRKAHNLMLRLPFLGRLIIQGEVTQFARTLSALLGHGVPIHRAFEVAVAASRNMILQAEFQQAGEAIRRGRGVGASLLQSAHLPAVLGQMLAIAEETNQLETTLDKIANSSGREVERMVAIFTRLLEPVMIIIVGAFIGFIVFAMMLPIFQMDFVVQ